MKFYMPRRARKWVYIGPAGQEPTAGCPAGLDKNENIFLKNQK